MKKNKDIWVLNTILCLVVLMVGFLFGSCIHAITSDKHTRKQIEVEIKHELKKENRQSKSFWIKDTNIHITPWKDGSGVIRIVERDRIAGAGDDGYRKVWERE